jgi:hypothetical protein
MNRMGWTHNRCYSKTITYCGLPLEQRPLLYASEVDQNFAIALRPGGAPATLDVENQRATIRALTEVEIKLAAYARGRCPGGLGHTA